MKKINKGFTLVELLVVMAILGVLVTLIGTAFRTAQARGRDAQRKSDLKQIANALELFFNDYGFYPPADGQGKIMACPYEKGGDGIACNWGVSKFVDVYPGTATERTMYFKKVPDDPVTGYDYYYRLPSGNSKKFQLFARLENSQDQDCLGGDCLNSPVSYQCGNNITCNFSITSSNTSFDEI
ncbi:prepilin-type N-terminal cleavage/methylation domain-containing protein [Patescibacteria group bacterium]|nr:prepilin-type N-terminal cleavage/methylation domain-containing protein [Patescibacteria group bacterium]